MLWVDISSTPRKYNYLLHLEDHRIPTSAELYIPDDSIVLASDKRLLTERFLGNGIPIPKTWVVETIGEIHSLQRSHPDLELCLKYPTGCGGSGHRLWTEDLRVPKQWPKPFLVQEFIRLERPEVYQAFGIGGEVFGWVVRRYPQNRSREDLQSPWVAHARGAIYEIEDGPPTQARGTARVALQATDLLNSFGCVDLLQRPNGEWVVLEVGTDGLFNHVD